MKLLRTLCLLLTILPGCLAQGFIEIKGIVLDMKTKAPLPFASISIVHSPIGTVSNDSGAFLFHIPVRHASDTMMISYIGYESFAAPVSQLQTNPPALFFLNPSPVVLDEVVVSSDGPKKLVMEATNAIPQVYPNTPYLMEGFHRSWEKIDFTDSASFPGTLIEAAVTIYDPGYAQGKTKKGSQEEIYINEMRRSAMMEGWNYHHGNFMRDLLDKNLVKYNRNRLYSFIRFPGVFDFPNTMIYEWEGTTRINEESLSVVSVRVPDVQKITASYKVYISDVDHAILRFELHGEQREIDYAAGPWHIETMHAVYIFKRYEQKPYLSYAEIHYMVKKLDQINRKVIRTEEYFREIMFNNIIITDVAAHRKALAGQKAKEVSLALQAKEYHGDFWRNYNVVLENPLDKEIAKYFEGTRPPTPPHSKKGK